VTNHEYRLIFMASKEHNDNSYIVTAFDKHRVQGPILWNSISAQKLSDSVKS
jgi:hypothetical protein